jgi:hypothetical protein
MQGTRDSARIYDRKPRNADASHAGRLHANMARRRNGDFPQHISAIPAVAGTATEGDDRRGARQKNFSDDWTNWTTAPIA